MSEFTWGGSRAIFGNQSDVRIVDALNMCFTLMKILDEGVEVRCHNIPASFETSQVLQYSLILICWSALKPSGPGALSLGISLMMLSISSCVKGASRSCSN